MKTIPITDFKTFEITGHFKCDPIENTRTFICAWRCTQAQINSLGDEERDDEIFYYFTSHWVNKMGLQNEVNQFFNIVSIDRVFFSIPHKNSSIELSITLAENRELKSIRLISGITAEEIALRQTEWMKQHLAKNNLPNIKFSIKKILKQIS